MSDGRAAGHRRYDARVRTTSSADREASIVAGHPVGHRIRHGRRRPRPTGQYVGPEFSAASVIASPLGETTYQTSPLP
jgi:hypothetical protein